MKKTLLALLLLSSTAQADCFQAGSPRLAGRYAFRGELRVLQTQDVRVVDTGRLEGLKQKREPVRAGYFCRVVSGLVYRCTQLRSGGEMLDRTEARMREELRSYSVEFDARASATLVNDSFSLGEWEVTQDVQTIGARVKQWMYLELRDRTGPVLHKARIDEHTEYVVRSCEKLELVLESRENTLSYLVAASLTR